MLPTNYERRDYLERWDNEWNKIHEFSEEGQIKLEEKKFIVKIMKEGDGSKVVKFLSDHNYNIPTQSNSLNIAAQRYYKLEDFHVFWHHFIKTVDKQNQSFKILQEYVKKNYPDFPITNYHNITDLQKDGLPFHFAVQMYDIELVKLLVKAGGKINQPNYNGDTALHIAGQGDDPRFAFKIIALGASLVKKNNFDESPIETMARNTVPKEYSKKRIPFLNDEKLLDLLYTIDPKKLNMAAHVMIYTRSKTIMRFLLNHGIPIDITDKRGNSALSLAVERLDENIVKFLLRHKANPHLSKPSTAKGNVPLGGKRDMSLVKFLDDKISSLEQIIPILKEKIYEQEEQLAQDNVDQTLSITRRLAIKDSLERHNKGLNKVEEEVEKSKKIKLLLQPGGSF